MFEAVVLAFGLAMDATAVAAARGIATGARRASTRDVSTPATSTATSTTATSPTTSTTATSPTTSTTATSPTTSTTATSPTISTTATSTTATSAADLRRREVILLPLLFGAFQAGMAALGWALGAWGGKLVARWDHWIAFGLLTLIGAKMLVEALRGGNEEDVRAGGLSLYLVLAFATSIDAAAAGITLPLVPVAPAISLALIGVVTAACSLVGYLAGRAVGGKQLEIVGGLILIGLGVRILVEHL